ncbi:MAG: pantoate--beta-alanine ligase, partial [bacterium]
ERYQTCVLVEQVTKSLCGESRPTHFRGVTTVVAKLFNIVQPDAAIFGEKDFQQLVAIKTMARDLDMPVEIVGCPIVREADGLAMSSRNKYLSAVERSAALALNKSLAQADGMIRTGETDSMKILSRVRSFIEDEGKGLVRLDYAKIVDAETLTDLPEIKRPALLALAAFVGKTRLIDNRAFAY